MESTGPASDVECRAAHVGQQPAPPAVLSAFDIRSVVSGLEVVGYGYMMNHYNSMAPRRVAQVDW